MGLPILQKIKREVGLNSSKKEFGPVLPTFDVPDPPASLRTSRKKYFLDRSGLNNICQWKVLKEVSALSEVGKCVCISMDTAFEIVKTEVVEWKEFDNPKYISLDESEFPCPYKYQL